MMDWGAISEFLKILLQLANVVVLGYALYKFLNRPHDTLADEVKKLKDEITRLNVTIEKMQQSLDSSHEKHRDQDRTNKVFKRVFILLANFEVRYCQETGFEHTADLVQTKKELEEYLAGE